MKHFLKILLSPVWLCFAVGAVAQTPQWEFVGEMPMPVSGGQVFALGDTLYLVGGSSDSLGGASPVIQSYHPQTGTWGTRRTLQAGRHGFAAAMDGIEMLICGGFTSTLDARHQLEVWTYPNAPGIMAAASSFNRVYANAAFRDRKFYLLGGYAIDDEGMPAATPFVSIYDYATGQWIYQDHSIFPPGLPFHQQAVAASGEMILLGGVYNSVSNRVYRFSLSSLGIERMLPNLNEARAGGQAVLIDSRIYLIGGYNDTQAALSSVEQVDLTGTSPVMSTAPALRNGRRECMAVRFKKHIYVFGGRDAYGGMIRTIERLDISGATPVTGHQPGPQTFQLATCYPNPFNSRTQIVFSTLKRQTVQVAVYALTGQRVKSIFHGLILPGVSTFSWDGRDENGFPVCSGLYLCRIDGEDLHGSIKMVLAR